ncbi:MAG TPA: hypothetical protein VHO48_08740 [Anaerolineaceae bacterium]|nr:hypothetical protein [Anaerolineaceae bacterium]
MKIRTALRSGGYECTLEERAGGKEFDCFDRNELNSHGTVKYWKGRFKPDGNNKYTWLIYNDNWEAESYRTPSKDRFIALLKEAIGSDHPFIANFL